MLNMTASEFKAWFDGFSHAINGTPSKEQWEVIKKKVEEISINQTYLAPLYTREPALTPGQPYQITCSNLISQLT